MGKQFNYGPKAGKKVKVQSHDGRTIEVPEAMASLYKKPAQPAAKTAEKKES